MRIVNIIPDDLIRIRTKLTFNLLLYIVLFFILTNFVAYNILHSYISYINQTEELSSEAGNEILLQEKKDLEVKLSEINSNQNSESKGIIILKREISALKAIKFFVDSKALLNKEKDKLSYYLEGLSVNVDPSIQVEKFQFDLTRIYVSGTAENSEKASEFIMRLKKSQEFSNIAFDNVEFSLLGANNNYNRRNDALAEEHNKIKFVLDGSFNEER